MAVKAGMSCSRDLTVPAGSLANGSSVGANTVNGPSPFSVSTSPVASSEAASVVNDPVSTAVATVLLRGLHGGTEGEGGDGECVRKAFHLPSLL